VSANTWTLPEFSGLRTEKARM